MTHELNVESAMEVTIQNGANELSLSEFLDGCANVESTSVVRSALEDFEETSTSEVINDHHNDINSPEAPEKYGIIFLPYSES